MDLIVDNGKPIEPSKIKKAMAAVKRDTEAAITLPMEHIQEMIAQKLWAESPWLRKYQSARLAFDDESATITFSTKSVEPAE